MGLRERGSESLELQLGYLVACTGELPHVHIPLRRVALCGPVLVGVRVVGVQDREVERDDLQSHVRQELAIRLFHRAESNPAFDTTGF